MGYKLSYKEKKHKMRIVLTGGTGLIGRALSEKLVADGHELLILTRNPNKKPVMPRSIRFVGWDAETLGDWASEVDGADAIINLAGESLADGRWTDSRKESICQSRINVGKALVQAVNAATNKPSVLLQASAVGYYGSHTKNKIYTESAAPGSDYLAQICFDWESSTQAVERTGVRRAIMRTGIVLSSTGGAWPKLKLPFMLFAGGPMGSGNQWYPWIHIADEVRAIQFLLENEDASGPYNLSAPNPLPNKAFAKVVGDVMNRPAFMPAPGFALRTVLGEMATIILEGQRAVPQKLLDAGFTFLYPEARAAIAALEKKTAAESTTPVQEAA